MSLSGLISQKYVPRLSALQAVLEKYHARRSNVDTLEEQLLIEAEALEMFRSIIEQDTMLNEVTRFDHPDKVDLESAYGMYELIEKANNLRIQKLMEMALTRENNQMFATTELLGQVRRIQQKHAVLNLWENEKTRYFTGNKFLTTDGLDTRFTSLDPCDINTTQGILTLPIQSKQPALISDIRIAADSNGQPGSSDIAITTDNQNVRALIQAGSTDSFEYERLDGGPCNLTLVMSLSRPQIVNQITVLPIDIGVPVAFEIKDIVFTTSAKESISVFDLLASAQSRDLFSVPVATFGEPWELTYLPVEAVSVAISFTQTQAYQVEVATADGGTALRDRYAIPLKQIGINQILYKTQGGINSTPVTIRRNLYAVEPVIRISPDNVNLYDLTLEVSFDSGVTWKIAGTDDDSSINLVDPNLGSFLWRISLVRNAEAFNTFTSFFEADQPVGELRTLLRSSSRFNSPSIFSLTSTPADTNIHVVQPKVARRGTKDKALRLGTTSTGTTKLKLPFKLNREVKPSSTKVYVGGVEYTRKEAGNPLSALEWSFTDDHEQVMLGPDLPAGSPVDVALDEELLLLEEREDGYYHKMRFLFDPEKDNIELNYLGREPARTSIVLPRGETIVFLGFKNLLSGTLVLTSTSGASYTEVDTRTDVFDDEDLDYYVDYQNGVIYLATAIGDDNVRAAFDYQEQRQLLSEQFSIVYEDGRPWGIRILKDALEATTIEETISEEALSVIDLLTGEFGIRRAVIPLGSVTKKQLSTENIIKGTFSAPTDLLDSNLLPEEVDYIDGVSEFLGLTLITNEQTTPITAGGDGVVSFALSARALWYRDFGLLASNTNVFETQVNSISAVTTGDRGDYFVDDDGTVYVQINADSTLPNGIRLSYYAKDPLFDPANKFSVNYQDGLLYAHTPLNQDATVLYKTAAYKAGYDVANDIPFTYRSESNSVEVKTERLNPVNNLVKVFWTEQPIAQVTPALQQYFSPLISLIGFKFS